MNNNEFIQMVDKAIDHLEAQGHPAADAGGNCLYQYEDEAGNVSRCIVGWMIEDEATRKAADSGCSKTVGELIQDGVWGTHLTEPQGFFLESLQEIHDDTLTYKDDVDDCFERGIKDMRHALTKYSKDIYKVLQENF